ncbi:hypothetical protein OVA14_10380 [Agrococcus sp. SL85]|uniref:hypothetical protein n=1 Tax=Agrococcus sp. SL85 TaxID=2995141 RepID=UPI00226CBBF1|nr:hypothetical protein [Agrococcus sp. SL85]WAC65728.1 hypothetical protein OVA14_10380 [Agrococcus sp. SL85]
MPRTSSRPAPLRAARRALPALGVAAAALALAGCIPLPPPIAPEATVDPSPQPERTTAAPTPAGTASPGDTAAPGALPALLAIGDAAPEGLLAGWQSSLTTDAAFEVQPESDFPVGPTISVLETATGCTFWAYQGYAEQPTGDEQADSEAVLAALTSTSPDDWEADVVTVEAPLQGSAVEFLSIVADLDDGGVRAVFARAYAATGTEQAIDARCPAGQGDVDHIDAVVAEHVQVSFDGP